MLPVPVASHHRSSCFSSCFPCRGSLWQVAPAQLRGALVALHQFGIGAGFTLAYGVGCSMAYNCNPCG